MIKTKTLFSLFFKLKTAIETMARSKKQYFSLIFESFFSFGQLFLVLAAFFLRDWRHLTYIIFIPLLPFVAFIWLVLLALFSLVFFFVTSMFRQNKKCDERVAAVLNGEQEV